MSHFYADLHIHSKYSRACSKDCDLEHLAWWAARKGVSIVGTGDFTHPAWIEELRQNLVPAESGVYRLTPEIERRVARTLPPVCRQPVRFLLSVEISTIYKKGERTRKVHHLIYVPDFAAAERVTAALARIGNLASDGRPILGLDSRDLLEITLESDPGSYLVPAHAWTPWFSVLGSKSGFDAVADCYDDLADHIFAVETGLSSDPAMNWRVGSLDRYRLVSNSDAHSPPALAREASAFDTTLDYYGIRSALETGEGFAGSVEFFPEEGKYHLDGHRKCGVRLEPSETRTHDGRCPECSRPLTVGVLHRVEELADRPEGYRPPDAADFRNLVPLPEIVGEIRGVGPRSKSVIGHVAELVAALGPELTILEEASLDEVRRAGGELLGEAIGRLRRGEVLREAGYDGEYGAIQLFQPGEIARTKATAVAGLFDLPADVRDLAESTGRKTSPASAPSTPSPQHANEAPAHQPPRDLAVKHRSRTTGVLDRLDPEQRAAAEHTGGPLLIVAGPGTGKTRTLTHRIAHLVTERGVPPEQCLAITFTRRAAEELRERLAGLMPAPVTVTTFHGLGAMILREQHDRAGLTAQFRIADEADRLAVAKQLAGDDKQARRIVDSGCEPELRDTYEKLLRENDLVDFTDLLRLPVQILTDDPELAAGYRDRWRWISVDEYQDVDETQYALLRLLTAQDGNLTAIGDPDQAIYSFRGADVGFFLSFQRDFPTAVTTKLSRNYRSSPAIVTAATQAIAPSSFVRDRVLTATESDGDPKQIAVYEAADERAEADFVARTIDRLLGGASFHSLDSGRADGHGSHGLSSFAEVAVLYRTDGQAGAVMEALSRAGMPYQKRSHDRLAKRPGVREIARELRHHGAGPLSDRIRGAVQSLSATTDEERMVDLRTAVDLLNPLAEKCGDDIDDFLSRLALGAEVDLYDPRADRIALLTLHAAKGLEFPVVFVTGCEEGLLPLRLPGADDIDDAEERRLLFVGMTRARTHLYLSYARRRARHGTERDTGASRFLRAIDASLIDRVDATGTAHRKPRDRQLRLI